MSKPSTNHPKPTYAESLLKLVVLSDIHLRQPGKMTRGLDTTLRFRSALNHIQNKHLDADLCLFAGDIADCAEPKSYELFDEVRKDLPLTQYVLLGNHDDRPTYLKYAQDPMVDAHGFVQGSLDIKGHRILMIDSSEPGKLRGEICELRLSWIREQLEEASQLDLRVILVLHHNPCALQMPVDTYRLAEPEKLLEVLTNSPAKIIQLIAGHCHISTAGSWGGIPCATISGNQHSVEPFLRGRTGQQECYTDRAVMAVVLSDGLNCAVHFDPYTATDLPMDASLFPRKLNQAFEDIEI